MYYILAFIAFLFFSLGIFLMVSKKKKVIVGTVCLTVGIVFFVSIPLIAIHSFLFSPTKKEVKKESVKLTLQDFSAVYTTAANLFDASSGLVFSLESAGNADVAKARINDISSINMLIEKDSVKTLRGIMISVGNSNDSGKMLEALKTTYAIVKIFEPQQTTESIPDFVQKLLTMESGSSTNGENVIYTINQSLGNTILSIRYPNN